MKKLFLMLAVSMMTASVSAQNTAVTANKAGDNWYIGVNAGVATPVMKINDFGRFKGFSPELGVRVGKNLTTVFGLALDINNYFGNKSNAKSMFGSKTFVNATDFDILTTWNLMNAFGGYQGQPRKFEVIALAGGGYSRAWAEKVGGINAKLAFDLALNLGSDNQYQLYVEPGVVLGQPYPIYANPFRKIETVAGKKWNGALSLKVGFNYKFGTSNGTHNFKIAELRDQAEVDALNAKINELRGDVDAKNGQLNAANQTINDLKKKLAECEARPTQIVEEKKETLLQPIVIFRQGKSTIDAAQYASVEMVAKYLKNHPESKVLVKGYASPEGKAELNQKLSEARATAVANALIKRYKISKDRITTQGLGATSEISEENDFNRVAMFVDTTK
ncbi:MAG: OmpA family protein [Prevotella sp.]|jgi:outer membrane protein OmpA-like peptidoglycan-associated protein|nr:OmpA family protein [Prevotella sp.]MBQ8456775.1 OmpA family protein [Prevotella sp.]